MSTRTRRAAALAVGVCAVLVLVGCSATSGSTGSGSSADTEVGARTASIASVKPATASVVQQRTVTITGTGLGKVRSIQFGNASAAVHSVHAGTVTVTAPPAVNFQPGKVAITLKSARGAVVASKKTGFSYTSKTGIDTQLAYAMKYWKNYNTEQFGDLNSVGGDCANFVSQTLLARGWQMNDDWYNHDAGGDWSPAWGYVPAMDTYFAEHADELGLTELSFDQRSQVSLGDVAIFDWDNDGSPDHVQIVTAIKKAGGTIKIEMASHNDDGAYRDLDELITQLHPGGTGHFWHPTR